VLSVWRSAETAPRDPPMIVQRSGRSTWWTIQGPSSAPSSRPSGRLNRHADRLLHRCAERLPTVTWTVIHSVPTTVRARTLHGRIMLRGQSKRAALDSLSVTLVRPVDDAINLSGLVWLTDGKSTGRTSSPPWRTQQSINKTLRLMQDFVVIG